MNKDIPSMADELRDLISQVKGVKGISESFTVHYVTLVDSQESKENVRKVAQALSSQAKKFGFDLDIVAATQEEIDESKRRFATFSSVGDE